MDPLGKNRSVVKDDLIGTGASRGQFHRCDADGLKDFVESGLGGSLIPHCVRTLNRPNVAIRPISPKSQPIPLCATWLKSADNPALMAFLEIMRTAKPAIKAQMEI